MEYCPHGPIVDSSMGLTSFLFIFTNAKNVYVRSVKICQTQTLNPYHILIRMRRLWQVLKIVLRRIGEGAVICASGIGPYFNGYRAKIT